VKFLEGIVAEDIVDVGEAEQKTKELGQLSTVEERDAMIDTMKRLEENESDGETE
jgi:hypothetical protein